MARASLVAVVLRRDQKSHISDPFEVRSGVRQGDAISTMIVFDLKLETAIGSVRRIGVKVD